VSPSWTPQWMIMKTFYNIFTQAIRFMTNATKRRYFDEQDGG